MWSLIFVGTVGIIAISLGFLMIQERKGSRKIKYGLGIAVAIATGLLFSIFPIENLFYSFSSSDSLANYICKGGVIGTLDGETSSLILGYDNDGDVLVRVAPKKTSGYKIPNAMSTQVIGRDYSNLYTVEIISGNSVDDYYVLVSGLSKSTIINLTDNYHSSFVVLSDDILVGEDNYKQFYAYAFIGASPNVYQDYQITIRNQTEVTQLEIPDSGAHRAYGDGSSVSSNLPSPAVD